MTPPASASDLWAAWLGLAAVGGLLALDETSFAQTWLAQPLPAALCAGLVVGDPAAALVPGFFMQLLVLGNLPVGVATVLDATSASVGVVGGAMLAGWRPAGPDATAGLGDVAAAWPLGLVLVVMAAASHLGGVVVRSQRRAHLAWKLSVYRQLRDGRFELVEWLHRRALGAAALRGALVTFTLAVVVSLGWRPLTGAIPDSVREMLALAPLLTVPLAVGSLGDRFGLRRAAPLLAIGLAAGLLLGRYVW